MNIIMNGDIYLRRNPEYIDYTFEEIEELQMDKELIAEKFDMIREDIRDGKLKLDKIIINGETISPEKFEEEAEEAVRKVSEIADKMIEQGKPIYDSYKKFWVLIITDDGIRMVEQSDKTQKKVIKYDSAIEMEEEFISLREFLEKSEYLGKEYHVYGDFEALSMCSNDEEVTFDSVITYYAGDRAIIFNKKSNKFELSVAGEFNDNIIDYNIHINEEYRDKAEIYQVIYKQLSKKKGLNM